MSPGPWRARSSSVRRGLAESADHASGLFDGLRAPCRGRHRPGTGARGADVRAVEGGSPPTTASSGRALVARRDLSHVGGRGRAGSVAPRAGRPRRSWTCGPETASFATRDPDLGDTQRPRRHPRGRRRAAAPTAGWWSRAVVVQTGQCHQGDRGRREACGDPSGHDRRGRQRRDGQQRVGRDVGRCDEVQHGEDDQPRDGHGCPQPCRAGVRHNPSSVTGLTQGCTASGRGHGPGVGGPGGQGETGLDAVGVQV